MPIMIGAKPESSFQDPIGLLNDCHRRIERFLSVLVKVAGQAHGQPLSDEQRTALETALRYFREAAPKHTADEEQSLFPRLRQAGQPEALAALEQVEMLERDHAYADRGHAEVDRLGRLWLAEGALTPSDAARLSSVLSELSALYERHIRIEEREVFPVAARVLAGSERAAIGGEMEARRRAGMSGR
jgi:hemerythrin-like domain-containing protein